MTTRTVQLQRVEGDLVAYRCPVPDCHETPSLAALLTTHLPGHVDAGDISSHLPPLVTITLEGIEQ